MDPKRFDDLARGIGTRRTLLKGLIAGIASLAGLHGAEAATTKLTIHNATCGRRLDGRAIYDACHENGFGCIDFSFRGRKVRTNARGQVTTSIGPGSLTITQQRRAVLRSKGALVYCTDLASERVVLNTVTNTGTVTMTVLPGEQVVCDWYNFTARNLAMPGQCPGSTTRPPVTSTTSTTPGICLPIGSLCSTDDDCCSGACESAPGAPMHHFANRDIDPPTGPNIFVTTTTSTTTAAPCGGLCGPGETCCSSQCVDLTADPNNCGTCGNVCAAPNGACLNSTCGECASLSDCHDIYKPYCRTATMTCGECAVDGDCGFGYECDVNQLCQVASPTTTTSTTFQPTTTTSTTFQPTTTTTYDPGTTTTSTTFQPTTTTSTTFQPTTTTTYDPGTTTTTTTAEPTTTSAPIRICVAR